VIGAVIGEFVAAQEGLGYLILISTAKAASQHFDRADGFAANEARELSCGPPV
jgi:hypothetical protein